MISYIIGLVLIGSSFSWAAVSSDDVLRAAAMAPNFTRCAGLYDAAALIQQSNGRIADTRFMMQRADGAETTAVALLMVSGTSPGEAKVMAGERRRAQALYHLAFLKAGNAEALVQALSRCSNDYLPVQEAVLSALRRYAEQGKQDQELWSQMIIDAIKDGSSGGKQPAPAPQ